MNDITTTKPKIPESPIATPTSPPMHAANQPASASTPHNKSSTPLGPSTAPRTPRQTRTPSPTKQMTPAHRPPPRTPTPSKRTLSPNKRNPSPTKPPLNITYDLGSSHPRAPRTPLTPSAATAPSRPITPTAAAAVAAARSHSTSPEKHQARQTDGRAAPTSSEKHNASSPASTRNVNKGGTTAVTHARLKIGSAGFYFSARLDASRVDPRAASPTKTTASQGGSPRAERGCPAAKWAMSEVGVVGPQGRVLPSGTSSARQTSPAVREKNPVGAGRMAPPTKKNFSTNGAEPTATTIPPTTAPTTTRAPASTPRPIIRPHSRSSPHPGPSPTIESPASSPTPLNDKQAANSPRTSTPPKPVRLSSAALFSPPRMRGMAGAKRVPRDIGEMMAGVKIEVGGRGSVDESSCTLEGGEKKGE